MKIKVYDSICTDGFKKGQRVLQIWIGSELVFEAHDKKRRVDYPSQNFENCRKVVELIKHAYEQGQREGESGPPVTIETTN